MSVMLPVGGIGGPPATPPPPGARAPQVRRSNGPHHRIPELRDPRLPGARLLSRAVRITLLVIALVLVAGAVASFLVPVTITVRAAGVLEPARVWPVRAMEPGLVYAMEVRTGEAVAAGQTLLRLDALALRAELAQARAEYETAGLALDKARLDDPLQVGAHEQELARAQARVAAARALLRQRMVESGAGADADVDSLLAAYRMGGHVTLDQAVSELRAAQAELRLAGGEVERSRLRRFDRGAGEVERRELGERIAVLGERLRRLEVAAPAAGIVLTERTEDLAGAAVAAGQVLLEVADTAAWRVVLLVPEKDVRSVHRGDAVNLRVEAFRADDHGVLRGTVSFVAPDPVPAAEAAGGARAGRYRVEVALDRRQMEALGMRELRRGYSVDGRIITRSGTVAELVRRHWAERVRVEAPW